MKGKEKNAEASTFFSSYCSSPVSHGSKLPMAKAVDPNEMLSLARW